MTLINFLQFNPIAFIIFCGVLGLLVGSFLNVVILRLPVMMERQWQEHYQESQADTQSEPQQIFNLITPRSACPQCGHTITALENIPVFSYLFLKGRCSSCDKHIPLRYPLTEILTCLLSIAVAWHFGFSWQAAMALPLTWALVSLSIIDFDYQLLPDSITLPFLWIGLLLSLFNVFTDSHSAIIGAAIGYLSLWSIYQAFKILTGKEGMGYGDFKLLALFGAWLGWQNLLSVILLSSLVGAIFGISMILLRGRDKNIPIPFGPYLATAGWITLLWGDKIIVAYQNWAGIT